MACHYPSHDLSYDLSHDLSHDLDHMSTGDMILGIGLIDQIFFQRIRYVCLSLERAEDNT